jgi:hypothetical protein
VIGSPSLAVEIGGVVCWRVAVSVLISSFVVCAVISGLLRSSPTHTTIVYRFLVYFGFAFLEDN